jgi:hypothetical protein
VRVGTSGPESAALPWDGDIMGISWDVMRYNGSITNIMEILIWLVVSTPLKNMKVGWDDYSQYMDK